MFFLKVLVFLWWRGEKQIQTKPNHSKSAFIDWVKSLYNFVLLALWFLVMKYDRSSPHLGSYITVVISVVFVLVQYNSWSFRHLGSYITADMSTYFYSYKTADCCYVIADSPPCLLQASDLIKYFVWTLWLYLCPNGVILYSTFSIDNVKKMHFEAVNQFTLLFPCA